MDTTRHEARIREMDRALAPGSETILLGHALQDIGRSPDPDASLAWWAGAYRALEHGIDADEILTGGDDWTDWTPLPPTPAALRAWRKAEGLTQERAGKIAGVERLAWARWESGTRAIPQWLRDTLMQRWGSAP